MTATRRSTIAPRSYEVSTTHGVVDYQTGEVAPIVEAKEKRITRYGFVGGYCLMGLLNITKLRKIKMSGTGKDLALLVVEEASYSGVCDKTYSQLAEELGVHKSQVTRLVSVLERNGIVYRMGGRKSTALLVNPSFAFRGTPAEHQTALRRWAEYHPLFAVKPVNAEVMAS
jgi:DNA-binding transcriptional ArsR family regulator